MRTLTLEQIYKALGLSSKSKQRWLRNYRQKSNFPFPYEWSDSFQYPEYLSEIKPFLKHGNFYAVEVLYNPPKQQETPWIPSGNGNSAPLPTDFPDVNEITKMLGLKMANRAISNSEKIECPTFVPTLYTIEIPKFRELIENIAKLSKEVEKQSDSILTMDRSLKDLQTIIANKPVSSKQTLREQIVALINTHARNGMGTQQELYNRMYKQYTYAHDAFFIARAKEYNNAHKPTISKIEFAEREGESVLRKMFDIIKAW